MVQMFLDSLSLKLIICALNQSKDLYTYRDLCAHTVKPQSHNKRDHTYNKRTHIQCCTCCDKFAAIVCVFEQSRAAG